MKYKNGRPEEFIHQGYGNQSNHRANGQLRSKVIESFLAKYRTSGPELISDELETIDDNKD
jgi:hypothetical protein